MRGVWLLVLVMVAAQAGGHGASIETIAEGKLYRVTFFTFEGITEGEGLRLAWAVENKTTREPVNVSNPQVVVVRLDVEGRESSRETVPLSQSTPGFLYADIDSGRQGTVRYNLTLPGETLPFLTKTCRYDDQGRLRCPGDPPLSTPAAPMAVALALVAAAALAARRT